MSTLLAMWFANIFSQSLSLSFHLLEGFFFLAEQKFFFFFFIMDYTFMVSCLRAIYQAVGLKWFLLYFSLKVLELYVLHLYV